MYKKNEFPDQNLIGKLLGSFYDPEIKPKYINIDFKNKKAIIEYSHNDFMKLFGDCIIQDDVYRSPGEIIYEKEYSCDGLNVIVITPISQTEFSDKKMKRRDFRYGSL